MYTFNCSLYVILDPQLSKEHSLVTLAKASIAGGATMLQLRDKISPTRNLIALASKLHALTQKAEIPLIINDRVDVALAIGAEGAHLGIEDIPVYLARSMLGKRKIIGASAKTIAQAKKAQGEGADYIGVGPVFATGSKADAGKPIGLTMLSEIVESVSIPVVGIGGITALNAASVVAARASGIAVISAVMGAKDPAEATRELKNEI